jgi:hypothetical protein
MLSKKQIVKPTYKLCDLLCSSACADEINNYIERNRIPDELIIHWLKICEQRFYLFVLR